jgi:hypothetical protein
VLRAVEGADARLRVGGAIGPERLGDLLLLERDRIARSRVEGAERAEPLVGAELGVALESSAQQGAGRLVVEEDLAGAADEEGGRAQARQEVAGEDELERFLLRGLDGRTLIRGRGALWSFVTAHDGRQQLWR